MYISQMDAKYWPIIKNENTNFHTEFCFMDCKGKHFILFITHIQQTKHPFNFKFWNKINYKYTYMETGGIKIDIWYIYIFYTYEHKELWVIDFVHILWHSDCRLFRSRHLYKGIGLLSGYMSFRGLQLDGSHKL